MKSKTRVLVSAGVAVATLAAGAGLWSRQSHAADHLDPPSRTDPMSGGTDRNADIADLFAWHQGTGASATFVAVLTFSGPNAPMAMQRMACDRNVLYNILIDNTGDAMPNITISARMGQDDVGNCFVQWTGIPGTTGPVVSPAESTRTFGGARVYAGLRDDPFFFDLQGFRDTLSMAATAPTGMGLRFANDRDFFAGKNSSALVVEVPLVGVTGSGTNLKVWATTSRIPSST